MISELSLFLACDKRLLNVYHAIENGYIKYGLHLSIKVICMLGLTSGLDNYAPYVVILCRGTCMSACIGIYIMSSELFPTPVRQMATGYSTGIGACFSVLAPYTGGPLV